MSDNRCCCQTHFCIYRLISWRQFSILINLQQIMTFNQFMHPRNLYRRKPDYGELGKAYPEFGAVLLHDEAGRRPTINYADPKALRALTTTLLKNDFGLTVTIPEDRLVPTLPMRLNYLLWVEDLLQTVPNCGDEEIITGIDIGTGCCAVFPLLGVTLNKRWSFVATDIDEKNLSFSKQNIDANGLSDRIKLLPGSKDSMFSHLLRDSLKDQKVHFIMTNPPFFSDEYNDSFEADHKKDSNSNFHSRKVCSSSANEAVVEGGEFAFVKQIIDESLEVKDRISIYTVMFGRRKSFLDVKQMLKEYQDQSVIASFAKTELCQGNTKRWALAWTFCRSIQLSKAFHVSCIKAKPLLYYIPSSIQCCDYEMKAIAEYIQNLLLNDLQISTFSMIGAKKRVEFDIKANTNTWSNQRKKRRQNKGIKEVEGTNLQPSGEPQTACCPTPKRTLDEEDVEMESMETETSAQTENEDAKKQKSAFDICKSDLTLLLHCGLKVKREKQKVLLKIVTKEMSQNKESTAQVLQYLKNKLV